MKNLIRILCLSVLWFSCEEQNLDIYGCTVDTACNFNPDANIFDDSCLENDCNGDCGGDAVVDECGICEGDGSSCLCEDVDCTFLDTQCITGSCVDGECIPVYHENGFSCDDNILCTVNDSCDGEGSCGGIIMSCDDGNPCTEDICDGSGGCI